MKKKSKWRIAAPLFFCVVAVGSATAQEGKIQTHKAKTTKHVSQPAAIVPTTEKPPQTIPMDFSGMSKRGVDLPLESKTRQNATGTGPGLNSNGNGGFTPGMNFNF